MLSGRWYGADSSPNSVALPRALVASLGRLFAAVGQDVCCCGCYMAAFRRYIASFRRFNGLGDVEVRFVNNRSKIFHPAYFIALDHDYKSVVLAIRGTFSLTDMVTDLAAKVWPDSEVLDRSSSHAVVRNYIGRDRGSRAIDGGGSIEHPKTGGGGGGGVWEKGSIDRTVN